MKRVILGILLFVAVQVQAQEYPPYWHQRATLFGALPVGRGDIVFLGNSITDGCEWHELFGNTRIKNRGISGDTTDGMLARLDDIADGHPSKIFIMAGTNDIARGKSPADVAQAVGMMIDSIKRKSPATLIYLQSILPVSPRYGRFAGHTSRGSEIREANRLLRALAAEKGVVFIDLHTLFTDPETGDMNLRYTNDGLHLTAEGYMVWRDMAAPYVKESKKSYERHLKPTDTEQAL